MSRYWMLMILLLGFFMLFTVSCGPTDSSDDEIDTPTSIYDISPTVAEWVIGFNTLGGKSPYFITAFWIGGLNPPDFNDTAELIINGEVVDIISLIPGVWIGECNVTPGSICTVKYVYEGVTKTETTLKMVNLITDSDFPEPYNPAQSATFTWSLPVNNDHQIAGVTAYTEVEGGEDYEDDYTKEIPVTARTFTVPANPIANVPAGAEYSLGISEVNFKVNNRTALMSICTSQSGSMKKYVTPLDMKDFALKIYRTLSR